jgi:hypothetical protein
MAIYAREFSGGTPITNGSNFKVSNDSNFRRTAPDVAFVSPTQYIMVWESCDDGDCVYPSIYGSRYTGNFNDGNPGSPVNDDFLIYGNSSPLGAQSYPRIAADMSNGSFVVAWQKTDSQIYAKFFNTNPSPGNGDLTNIGIGFSIHSTLEGNRYLPDVGMDNTGKAIIGWEGQFGANDTAAVGFQLLNNPTFTESVPVLPCVAQQIIEPANGKTFTVPENIGFPDVTATTTSTTEAYREIDENQTQPLYFQLNDLGGNGTYSVSIQASDFTYTDIGTDAIYTIPSSSVAIKNYDGNHPITPTPPSCNEFEMISGTAPASDFTLDNSTCDYMPLNSQQTLLNRTNAGDPAQIRWYPVIRITIPPLTPPGSYTGTLTLTSV